MKDLSRISRIAHNTRKWAENLQQEKGEWTERLQYMCGVASYELFLRLKRAKLDPWMCFSSIGHAFVRCNGHLIDITATQFLYCDAVVIVEENSVNPHNHPFWVSNTMAKTTEDIAKAFKDWPSFQIHPKLKRRMGRSS